MDARDHFRAHERRRIDLAATISAPDDSPSAGFDAIFRQDVRVRDLGLGGAGVELLEAPSGEGSPLGPAVKVTLEVMAPARWDPIVVSGSIAWLERGALGQRTRAGVRFDHRDPAALHALFQLLADAPSPA
jgi:PilZ domain